MNDSSFSLVDRTQPMETEWISDLLLVTTRYNKTRLDAATTLLDSEFGGFIALAILYATGTLLNLLLLISILNQPNRRRSMTVKILVGALTFANLLWSLVWLAISIGIFATATDLDNFEEEAVVVLTKGMEEEDNQLREGLWEILAHQLVDNLLSVQSILILAISLERYLNLFQFYSPYVDNSCAKVLIVMTPFFVACTLLDHRVLSLVIPKESAMFCRLCLLVCCSYSSFLFAIVTTIRPAANAAFEPRLTSSLSKSLPPVILIISLVDIFYRTNLFFRLLETDFKFVIVTGSDEGDQWLTAGFYFWNWISIWLLHLFPTYFPLSLVIFVRHYRMQVGSCFSSCFNYICGCCRNKEAKVDYNSETMRSIMMAQKRERQMMSSIH